ncbi:formamidopyrimidine-DNA glycolase [Thiobacillus denitrificans ATCC 25259]|uniref:Formamidopyrimidine-DNA glycosylase n=1 Tax=Thiobacillus denitrificans (strain ATCC 25259 / T1) TaxID=292415 RepID=FPG_THIDA|nr:bifunctional DNA-formamidopyrimidine glycosylase/DNA-(apurinic or apyrimidinic site) lyase [Thiobacillus denitrificans]Q3SLR9.3 RecName: Full=Formamidopyrimidine-DNA glycosylase; Short=Fapy-DNA glycosylase; AltName: Full=DNA-(apurinic or apyrimidinic site) lyase MutM; Short=AP lyase MutM [Thiobacillus denitrificans ATCC 25259]AAZ96336.1 formamidopyrimidine-DNA glycolase [Thiobacillus denitrificans ATCC 25259]
MPELPEVETTRAGLSPRLQGRVLTRVIVREPRLRWPIPPDLDTQLRGLTLHGLARRGKYLLFDFGAVTQLVHLGMSGSLRLTEPAEPAARHDHVDWRFDDGTILRLRDPRRFGAVLLTENAPGHPLLAGLGPEPLSTAFDAAYLHTQCQRRKTAIKPLIMDAHVVVGVGNIYASESLFHAGIRPGVAAHRLSRAACARLADAIKQVLTAAIAAGGSSLRDYVQSSGELGYFQLQTRVYDREDAPCRRCATPIRRIVQAQRASFYCPTCQR